MASGEIKRYVVTFRFHEENLTDINELNNHLTRGGFTLTMSDDDGKVHELGINTFGRSLRRMSMKCGNWRND